jgi:hypothetical protein
MERSVSGDCAFCTDSLLRLHLSLLVCTVRDVYLWVLSHKADGDFRHFFNPHRLRM